ncbi:branched-chain amino acid ABC transporter permease [Aquisalimonas sp. 2447]|uniref:branched-chain amino acid ABC transporter permease n=1 Tax=Aquisalimonas sp. 2447 TaxID=2740807 RepID=UPI00143243E4|nr:branched-chain amino acid ABC transporter permease [Aquisalimonas sp. 2447]QIT55491.1 branched-chain amino acid ABC transporter permease [Aquisalimonas sp. 2447]
MEISGIAAYLVSFFTFVGIYAILALGLNMQWGFTGQFNIGIAGFFAVGAYTSAILTTPESPWHVGGFQYPFLIGVAGAVIASALVGLIIGAITARLRTDYLAIATIGIAETLRLVIANEGWLTNGVRGMSNIDRPFSDFFQAIGLSSAMGSLIVVAVFLVGVYFLVERARRSPWGRVLRAIREDEPATAAAGKNIRRFRLEAFVVGSAIMGLGGALYAHYFGFLSPEAFLPLYGTFLVWVMLIAGGSGNNKGALLGAVVIWTIWSGSEFVMSAGLPEGYTGYAGPLRVILIGVLLQVILITRPEGILPEKAPPAIAKGRRD